MVRYEEEKKEEKKEPVAPNEKLLKTRSILLSGEINKDSADAFVRDLLILENESSEPVKVFINSPGGDVDAGYAIFDMIRFVSCPVIIVGMGLVASAAALILLSVPSERRVGLPNSSYLIHQPLSQMRGNATEIEIHAKQLEKIKKKINKVISEQTGKDLEAVALDTDRDYWLDAEEAVSYGLISRVVKTREEI
ncbi:MAG: ATP-dependent Clp protease proteolytic subunit [Sphaerochaetaceae bacterium]|nr:ATP-dependent Clp protease proteolytic subunit [Sphaerochaetaceae bacterium]